MDIWFKDDAYPGIFRQFNCRLPGVRSFAFEIFRWSGHYNYFYAIFKSDPKIWHLLFRHKRAYDQYLPERADDIIGIYR